MDQKASVGRIVHYVLPGGPRAGEHRPAIIAQVWTADTAAGGTSNLVVFKGQSDDGGDLASDTFRPTSVTYDAGGRPGTWHWPERE